MYLSYQNSFKDQTIHPELCLSPSLLAVSHYTWNITKKLGCTEQFLSLISHLQPSCCFLHTLSVFVSTSEPFSACSLWKHKLNIIVVEHKIPAQLQHTWNWDSASLAPQAELKHRAASKVTQQRALRFDTKSFFTFLTLSISISLSAFPILPGHLYFRGFPTELFTG